MSGRSTASKGWRVAFGRRQDHEVHVSLRHDSGTDGPNSPACPGRTSMSSITPHYKTIKELLQSRSFSIDEYQREYKWGRKNIEELVSDLLGKFVVSYHEGDTPLAASGYASYFLGSIIVTRRGNKNYLVDGQQRVTSLTLLLIYLYRAAKDRALAVTSTIEP